MDCKARWRDVLRHAVTTRQGGLRRYSRGEPLRWCGGVCGVQQREYNADARRGNYVLAMCTLTCGRIEKCIMR